MFVIHLKLFEASFLVLGHTILFGLPLFLFDDSPTDTRGNRTNVCDFHICIVCFCFCVLHWPIALPLYWGPIHQAGPPLPRSLQFSTQCLWKGAWRGAGGGGIGLIYTCTWVSTFSFTHSCVCTFTCACTCIFLCICTLVRGICTTRSPRPPRDKSSPWQTKPTIVRWVPFD